MFVGCLGELVDIGVLVVFFVLLVVGFISVIAILCDGGVFNVFVGGLDG